MKLQVNNSTWLNKSTIQVNNYKSIIQLELNRVKNPNWPEASQRAIYKRGRVFDLGTTVNKSS